MKLPPEDRSSIILGLLTTDPNLLISDYSSFESHFKPAVMQAMEMPLYRFLLTNQTPEFNHHFLQYWTTYVAATNEISLASQLRMKIDGVRMSGEMNTSLANGWCNLVLICFAMWDRGATWDEILALKGYVEGDDGIFNIPPHIAPTSEQMQLYGFRLKMATTNDITEASFCGMVFDPSNGVLITNPHDALLKLGWIGRTHLNVNSKTMYELMLAKAMSYAWQYNGCPVVSPACFNIVRQLLRAGHTVTDKVYHIITDAYHVQQIKAAVSRFAAGLPEKAPTRTTRMIVSRLYAIQISEQLELEKVCDAWRPTQFGVEVDLTHFPARYVRCWDDYVANPRPVDLCARRTYYDRLANHTAQYGVGLPLYDRMSNPHRRKYPSLRDPVVNGRYVENY